MDIRKFSWARPLALFMALTVIMMYSVTLTAFAVIGDVKVHDFPLTPDAGNNFLVVKTVINETDTYTALAYPKNDNSNLYEGAFNTNIPLTNGDALNDANVFTTISTTVGGIYRTFGLDHSSATGSDSANVFVGVEIVPSTFNLTINKIADNYNVTLGSIVTFTITAKNSGNTTIAGVMVTDNWPSELVDVMIQSVDGNEFNLDTKIWDVGSIGPNNSDTKILVLKATANAIGTVTNTAVGTAAQDTSPGNNTDDAVIQVFNPEAPPPPTFDLKVSKTVNGVSTVTVSSGALVTFVIKATNNSTTTATGVVINDSLPTGLTIYDSYSSIGTYDGSLWNIGSIAAGANGVLTVTATAIATSGAMTNTATITSAGVEVDPEDNTASATVNIDNGTTPPPTDTFDLEVNKTVNGGSSATVSSGAVVTFVITATNNSTTAATGVVINDILPIGLTTSVSNSSIGTYNGSQWNIGSLGAGANGVLTVTAVAIATSGSMINTATITSAGVEVDPEDNTASATVTVNQDQQPPDPKRDLGISKTVNISNVTIGNGVIFTITIRNNGETTYEGIEVRDTWPASLTQGTATPATGTAFNAESNIWDIDILGPGDVKVLTITAGTSVTGTMTNHVEILFGENEGDDTLANNTSSAIVSVVNPTTPTTTTVRNRTTPTPAPEPEVILTEPEVPMAELPVVIPEPPAPLSDVPQTSDTDNIWMLLGLMLASGLGLGILGRRKETGTK